MADWGFWALAGNLGLSGALAALAFCVHQHGKHPTIAHILWVLVLAKLVTPPILPLVALPATWQTAVDGAGVAQLADTGPDAYAPASVLPVAQPATVGFPWLVALLGVWVAGSLLTGIVSLSRVVRFSRHLAAASDSAPTAVQALAGELASTLGLRRTPHVVCARAQLVPFVWWTGGLPKVVLPNAAIERFEPTDIRMVLAHELAHIRRRDHWVRWLEWAASVAFWWNPIVWLARHCVRESEETACDALVLDRFRPDRRVYASSLLTVAEFLSIADNRPPATASAMSRGGDLERRITMIVSNRSTRTPRWLRPIALVSAVFFLPAGMIAAQDLRAVERRLGAAVHDGDLTLEQANIMLGALKTSMQKERPIAKDRAAATRELRRLPGAGRRKSATEHSDAFDKKREFMAVIEKIKAAVDEGELSVADAERKIRGLENKHAHTAQKQRKLMLEIMAAVRSGKLSNDAAVAKILALRKGLSKLKLRGSEFPIDRGHDPRAKLIRDREQNVRRLEAQRAKLEAAERALAEQEDKLIRIQQERARAPLEEAEERIKALKSESRRQ